MKTRPKAIFSIFAAALLASPLAHAQADAPVHQFVRAFNTGEIKAVIALHTASPTITDAIAPYIWQGPGAVTRWLNALNADSTAHGDTDPSVSLPPHT